MIADSFTETNLAHLFKPRQTEPNPPVRLRKIVDGFCDIRRRAPSVRGHIQRERTYRQMVQLECGRDPNEESKTYVRAAFNCSDMASADVCGVSELPLGESLFFSARFDCSANLFQNRHGTSRPAPKYTA